MKTTNRSKTQNHAIDRSAAILQEEVSQPQATGRNLSDDAEKPAGFRTEGHRKLAEYQAKKRLSNKQVAKELGVPASTVGRWHAGGNVSDQSRRKIQLWSGIPSLTFDRPDPKAKSTAMVKAEGGGIGGLVSTWSQRRKQQGCEDGDWIELGRNEALALEGQLDEALAELSPLDQLTGSAEWIEVKRTVLGVLLQGTAARATVESVVAIEASRVVTRLAELGAEIQALHDEAWERTQGAATSVRVKDSRELLKLTWELRGLLKKSRAPVTAKQLVEGPPWKAVCLAAAAAIRPFPDERIALTEELDRIGEKNALARYLADVLGKIRHIEFPSEHYRTRPIEFQHDVLGYRTWKRQEEIATSVLTRKYTSVASGHKTGKSRICAGLAIWWYCVWPDAQVLLSNSTGKQLERVNWAEIRKLAGSMGGACLSCREAAEKERRPVERPCPHSQLIDGELHKTSLRGLISEDGQRAIYGASTKRSGDAIGFGGPHVLVIIDEASTLTDEMFQSWSSAAAAKNAKFLMVGNPLSQIGPHHDSFYRNSRLWYCITISSIEAAETGIDGLADKAYIDFVFNQDDRGAESPFFQARILGIWPTFDAECCFRFEDIVSAQDPDRYTDTPADGPLVVSLDPAGESGMGDESVFSVIRGLKVLEMRVGRGWTVEDHLEILTDLIIRHRMSLNEKAFVGIDADGVGAKIARRFDDYLGTARVPSHLKAIFELVPVHFGGESVDKFNYDLVRDEAVALLGRWLRHGGTFHADPKLEQEMQITKWTAVRRVRQNREIEVLSATRKTGGAVTYKKVIHRSPDRLESLLVFAWISHMRGILAIPERVATEARYDAEHQEKPRQGAFDDMPDQRGSNGASPVGGYMQRLALRKMGRS
jgi:hypothetical protein